MNIIIETGIPIPELRNLRSEQTNQFIQAFRGMSVGHSFFVPVEGEKAISATRCHASAAKKVVRKANPAFETATRIVDGGVRIWRVS